MKLGKHKEILVYDQRRAIIHPMNLELREKEINQNVNIDTYYRLINMFGDVGSRVITLNKILDGFR